MMYYLFIAVLFAIGLISGWPLRNLVSKEKKILQNLNKPEKLPKILYSEDKPIHVIFDVVIGCLMGVGLAVIGSQLWLLSDLSVAVKLLVLLIVGGSYVLLLYLAVYDAITMEIPAMVSYAVLLLLLVTNVFLVVIHGTGTFELWSGNTIWPVGNLITGLLAGAAIGAIVYFTDERGMGAGDILLAAILGLALGPSKTFIAFYITIISATIVGVAVAAKKGTFKNVPIPFVPFIVLGIVLTFLLWTWILPFVTYTIGLSFLS